METVQQKGQQLLRVLLLEAIEAWGILSYRPLQSKTLKTSLMQCVLAALLDSCTPGKFSVSIAYPKFEWSYILLRPAPELHHQVAITLGHVASHPNGVNPVCSHDMQVSQSRMGQKGVRTVACYLLSSYRCLPEMK